MTYKMLEVVDEHTINTIIDKGKSDYAIMSDIQIHGTDSNYVGDVLGYVVINNVRE